MMHRASQCRNLNTITNVLNKLLSTVLHRQPVKSFEYWFDMLWSRVLQGEWLYIVSWFTYAGGIAGSNVLQ